VRIKRKQLYSVQLAKVGSQQQQQPGHGDVPDSRILFEENPAEHHYHTPNT
jgi:hypothetical protein